MSAHFSYKTLKVKCEYTQTHIILSYHPGGTQLLWDNAAHKTGVSSFVLSRARTERSWPDGSVHHVFSLVPFPQSVWLEPLSQQCALSSVEVMVHVNEGKRRSSSWFQTKSRQANKKSETDNKNQRTQVTQPSLSLFIGLTVTNPTVVWFHHQHQKRLTWDAVNCIILWPWI